MSIKIDSLFNVNGLVALITGGGTGLGLMMPKSLALNGAHKVYIVGRRLDKLESAAKESPSGNIIPIVGDVTDKASIEAAAERVRNETGYLNLLVCNSGVIGPNYAINMLPGTSAKDLQHQVLSTPMEEFTNAFAVSVSVLVTGSIAAYNRNVGAGIAYNASKAAVTHLVKVLAGIFVPYSIRVNALAPGLFPSEISAGLLAGKGGTEEGSFPQSFIPAERTGDEQDMAGTILYMASRAGAYCNALILVIDGGRLTLLPGSY
ncbi:NAD(P)-binding protein [Tothia fuscella]|uniref:NAD(P)-binding protein n=1 Tax=Tothia fuscella TaxID=1048955 RepID=A0A9P4NXR1_9PEZI|nr:NAD(P)-binding protein [Tothia fuscella]